MDAKKRKTKGNFTDKENSDIFLKKHVGLIHCENKLTLIQRKICNILLFNALDKMNDQEIHEISLRQLCSLVGYNSNDSKLIKESIKSLISVVMEWNLLEDSKFLNEDDYPEDVITWNASALLAGASIRAGIVRYSYSPQIKSVLSSLDIYGRINLFVQAKFNSSYSLVLYENCVRFKNIKQTSWFPIELFRSLMGVSGDKYSSFKEFKRNVINVAVKEVNQKSDICIDPQFRKSGRNITAIQFTIKENESYTPTFRKNRPADVQVQVPQHSSLIEILTSQYRLSEKQADEIIASYEYEYIVEKINLIKTKKNIGHPGAYLISALKKDYKANDRQTLQTQSRVEQISYLRESKEASEIRSLKNKYMEYKFKTYLSYMQQQPQNVQEDIREKFEDFLRPNKEVFRLYKKAQLSSQFVRASFINFIDNHFSQTIIKILTFDEYITSEEQAIDAEGY
jgi:hypothetical protein